MPRNRQAAGRASGPVSKRLKESNDQEERIAVRSLAITLPSGSKIESHSHAWPQLIYATEGAMTIRAERGLWVVPPRCALWMPVGFEHELQATGTLRMRTLYLRPDVCEGLPKQCFVMAINGLLRELILSSVESRMLMDHAPEHMRKLGVLLDQIATTEQAPMDICWPSDVRARRVAEFVQTDLENNLGLATLCEGAGASTRTIERLFLKETGMPFGRWRQRAKLLHSLERLAAGDSVTSAGLAIGYDSTSAFIAMFKRWLGVTPGNYFGQRTAAS